MTPENRLRSRKDITWQRVSVASDGRARWLAFDPVARIGYRCGELEYWLFQQFNGQQTLRSILLAHAGQLAQQGGQRADYEQLAHSMVKRGLVQVLDASEPIEPAVGSPSAARSLASRVLSLISSSISWRVRGPNPERWLSWLAPHTDWLFSATALRLWAGLAIGVSLFVLADFQRLQEQASLWQWLIHPVSGTSLFMVFLLTRVLHELGHALLLTRLGGRVPDIGLMFVLGAPCVYCDVSDSWRLPQARQRAVVAAGGMLIELMVASLAAIVWLVTTAGWLNTLSLQTMVVCSISTLLINANPLMRFDGYYILSDWIDEPNLRARADTCLSHWVQRWVVGLPSRETNLSPRKHLFFIVFSGLGLFYRLGLSLAMASLLVAVYERWYLPWLGRGLALAVLVSWWGYPTVKLLLNWYRHAPDNWHRLRLAFCAAGLVGLICAVPLPGREVAQGWVQPLRIQGLYAPYTATLARVYQSSGQSVHSGDKIFELTEAQPVLRAIDLSAAARTAAIQLTSARRQRYFSESLPRDLAALETVAETAARQAEHAEQAVKSLTVSAISDGQLISLPAPRIVDVDQHAVVTSSSLWLADDQIGRVVAQGTMLGAVCSREQIVVLPLDDRQLQAISVGTQVRLQIQASGPDVSTGQVRSIVRLAHLDSIDRLAAEYEQTAMPVEGASALASGASKNKGAYAAIVQLPPGPSVPMHASARGVFVVASQTLAAHAFTWARRNLRWLVD